LPFGLLADTVSLCQKKSYSRDTSIEKGVSKDSRFPSDLIDDISGNLHISEITTGQVFSDGPVVYENTNGKFEIDLPLLNNGGTLRVQFDGNVVIGSQELPLRIDRQVTL
jgi:hypothetical protein